MSYYMGDYYRGDPFLGGLIGVGAKLIGKALPVLGVKLGGAKRVAQAVIRAAPISTVVGAGLTGAAIGRGTARDEIGMPRRRMNVANVRALRRAIRRAIGFEKLARRVGSFTRPGFTFRLKGRGRRKRV